MSFGESLYGKGCSVDVVYRDLQIRKSRFFGKVYPYDDIESVDVLFSLVGETKYDVIVPVSDKGVTFISRNKTQIEDRLQTRCACPDYEKLRTVEDKHLFMAFCEHNGIPHPKTKELSQENMAECAMTIGFPSLIKPDYSVGARGITRVESLQELQEQFPAIAEKYGSCTLQELIENEEYYYNVMLYRDAKGRFPAHAISKIVRMYPVHAGSSSCLITVENDELLDICKDCLDKLGWVGMADFDVLQRLDNKEYKIIEINARVPASLRAAAVSGVNFPNIIVMDALSRDIPQYNYQPGKTLRYMGIDIMWLMKSSNRFKSKPSWMKFCGKDIYYQDIIAGDASTWWTWLTEGVAKLTKRNKKIR